MPAKSKKTADTTKLLATFRAWESSTDSKQAKIVKRVEDSRTFLTGNEFKLTADKALDGVQLQLKLAKKLVDRYIATVLQYPYDVSVVADELPYFPPEHPFSQYLQQFADVLAVHSEENAAIVSEMLTAAVNTVRELLRVEKKLVRLVELALSDGCSYFKDGIDETEPDLLTVDVVQRTDIRHDPEAFTADDAKWWIHTVALNYEEAKAIIPGLKPGQKKSSLGQTVRPDTASGASEAGRDYPVREVWWEEVDGSWWRAHWCQDAIYNPVQSPLPHGRHPFHQLVGITNVNNADGMMFVLDIVYDLAVAKNKNLSATVHNVEFTSSNKKLINPDAVENADQLADNSVSAVVLKPKRTFAEAIMPVQGQDVSPAFNALNAMLDRELGSASDIESADPEGLGLVPNLGRVDLLKRNLKECLKSLFTNVTANLVLLNRERAYRILGGVPGVPTYAHFNTAMFREAVLDKGARYSVVVEDQEQMPTTGKEAAEITDMAIASATKARQMTGMPLSVLLAGHKFPNKNLYIKHLVRQEREQARAAAEAKARGEPDPETKEIQAQSEKERRDARAEVLKKILQKLADRNDALALVLETSGISERLFRIEDMTVPDLHELAGLLAAVSQSISPDPLLAALSTAVQLNLRTRELRAQMQQQAILGAQAAEGAGGPPAGAGGNSGQGGGLAAALGF